MSSGRVNLSSFSLGPHSQQLVTFLTSAVKYLTKRNLREWWVLALKGTLYHGNAWYREAATLTLAHWFKEGIFTYTPGTHNPTTSVGAQVLHGKCIHFKENLCRLGSKGDECLYSVFSSFPPSCSPAHGMVLSTVRTELPSSGTIPEEILTDTPRAVSPG